MNKEKNLTKDIRGKTPEPGSYWWYHYLDLRKASKMVVSEMERAETFMDAGCRETLKRNKEKEIEEKAREESMTEDAREIVKENNSNMEHDCKGANAWMDDEEILCLHLFDAFVMADLEGKTRSK